MKAYTFPIKTTPKTKISAVLSSLSNDVQTAVNKALKEVEKIGEFCSLVISEINGQVIGTIIYKENTDTDR